MKKIFWFIEDVVWNIRCRYNFWLHGPYGLTKEVEKMPLRFAIKYLRMYGATIGENCIIDSGFKIHRPGKTKPFKNLILGNNVYLGHNAILDLTEKIIIEEDVAIGANCQLWTHVGDFKNSLRDGNDYSEKTESLLIKEKVICYSGVLFSPGVVIGRQARVYAFSMVNKSIPDKEVWGGIPVRFIRKREF